MPSTISLESFKNVLKEAPDSVLCIDVRTPAEYRSVHIEGVRNIPLADLSSHIEELKKYTKVYVHCKSGGRTDTACTQLEQAGIDSAVKIEGGIDDWVQKGLPVIKGKQTISIMRQVQISAGGLTLFGVILGFTMDTNWFFLSGFIGAGLLFAGLSGTCGMAAVLSKMPWNN